MNYSRYALLAVFISVALFAVALIASPPDAPTNFTVSDCSSTTITWMWDDVSGEDGYDIFDNATDTVVVSGIAENATTTVETGLSPNTTYNRYIRAYTIDPVEHYYAENLSETSVTTNVWKNACTLDISPAPEAGDYLVIATMQIRDEFNEAGFGHFRLVRDETNVINYTIERTEWQYCSFMSSEVLSASGSDTYKYQLQFRAQLAVDLTTFVKDAAIIAIKLPTSNYNHIDNQTQDWTNTGAFENHSVLTVTPPGASDDYWIIHSSNINSSHFNYWASSQLKDLSNNKELTYSIRSPYGDAGFWMTHGGFSVLKGISSEVILAEQFRSYNSSYLCYENNVHIAAVRLSDSTWNGYADNALYTDQTMASSTGVAAVTRTFTVTTPQKYLIMGSCSIGTSDTNRVLNDTPIAWLEHECASGTTVLGEEMVFWMRGDVPTFPEGRGSFVSMRRLDLAAGSHEIRVMFRRWGDGTATIYARSPAVIAVPLEGDDRDDSGKSNVVETCTAANIPAMDNTSATFTFANEDTITVQVGNNSNPAGTTIELFYAKGDANGPTEAYSSEGTKTSGYSWDVTGLDSGTSYWLKARAQNWRGCWTGYCDVTVWSTVPAPPANFRCEDGSSDSLTWAWDDVTGEDGYDIFDKDTDIAVISEIPADETGTVETGLSPNATYARYIKAFVDASYLYYYAENFTSAVTTTSATVWENVCTLDMSSPKAGDYLVIATMRAKSSVSAYIYGEFRLVRDETNVINYAFEETSNRYFSFISSEVLSASGSGYKYQLQIRSETDTYTTAAQNAAIIAIFLPTSNYNHIDNQTEGSTTSSTFQNHSILTVTPPGASDYWIIHSSDFSSDGEYYYACSQLKDLSGNVLTYSYRQPDDDGGPWHTHGGFSVLKGISSDATLADQIKTSNSTYPCSENNVHIAAVRLSDESWTGYADNALSTQQQTKNTTGAVAVTKTFTVTTPQYYLIMASCGLGESVAESASPYAWLEHEYDSVITSMGSMRFKQITSQARGSFASMRRLDLAAGEHTIRIMFKTDDSQFWAYAQYPAVIAVPLEGGDRNYTDPSNVVEACTAATVPSMTNSSSTFTDEDYTSITVSVGQNGNPNGTVIKLLVAPDSSGSPGNWSALSTQTSGYSWVVTGMTDDTTYWFKARAQNYAYIWSDCCSITTWKTDKNYTPTAPTVLQINGCGTNASTIYMLHPVLSALYNDTSGDVAVAYHIELLDSTNDVLWNSSKSVLADTAAGSRTPDIPYLGEAFDNGETYKWRIKLWDQCDAASPWSEYHYFIYCDTYTVTGNETFSINQEFANLNIDPDVTLSLAKNITLTVYNNLTINGTIAIDCSATIKTTNLTMYDGSKIDGKGRGFAAASGPGAGGTSSSYGGGGGGYGGSGGAGLGPNGDPAGAGGPSYFNNWTTQFNPIYAGSGGGDGGWGTVGGKAGGAFIFLEVAGTFDLQTGAVVDMSGEDGESAGCGNAASGPGSGGGHLIKAKMLKGQGTLLAPGGDGADTVGPTWPYPSGAAAGGRTAVEYQSTYMVVEGPPEDNYNWSYDVSAGTPGKYWDGEAYVYAFEAEDGTCVVMPMEPCIGCPICTDKPDTRQAYQDGHPVVYNPVNKNCAVCETILSPGVGPVGLDFMISYNSLDPIDGPMGTGWTHNYNMRLLKKDSVESGQTYYTLVKECGMRTQFAKLENDKYLSVPWSGDFAELDTSDPSEYIVTQQDDRKLIFEASDDPNVKRLKRIEDANGNKILFSYDTTSGLLDNAIAQGRKEASQWTTVGVLHFDYTNDNLSKVEFARTEEGSVIDESRRQLTYDDDTGKLETATIADGTGGSVPEWTFNYDQYGTMTSMVKPGDDSANTWQVSIQDSGSSFTATFTDPANETTEVTTYPSELKYEVNDREDYTRKYEYDQRKNLVTGISETVDMGQGPVTLASAYFYDDNANMIGSTGACPCLGASGRGTKIEQTFNEHGDVLTSTTLAWDDATESYSVNRSFIVFEYDNAYNLTKVQGPIDPSPPANEGADELLDYMTTYYYGVWPDSKRHRLLSMTQQIDDTTSVTTTFDYDCSGNQIRRTVDPSGLDLVTESSFYTTTDFGSGYVYGLLNATIIDPGGLGITNRQEYDCEGKVVRNYGPLNPFANPTTYSYNVYGWLETTQSPEGIKSQVRYYNNGLVWKTWSESLDGSLKSPLTKQYYTSLGWLDYTEIYDNGHSVKYSTTYFDYDDEGRQTAVYSGCSGGKATCLAKSGTDYYENGMVKMSWTQLNDSENSTTINIFDELGRLLEVEEDGGSGTRITTRNVYNNLSQIIEVIEDYGGVGHFNYKTLYTINVRGETSKVSGPGPGYTDYKFDFLGRTTEMTQHADEFTDIVSKFKFDKGGRQIESHFDPTGDINLKSVSVFNKAGWVIERYTDHSGTTYGNVAFTYNVDGTIDCQAILMDADTSKWGEVKSYYDAYGRMTGQSENPSGLAINTSYYFDGLSRIYMTSVDPGSAASGCHNQSNITLFDEMGRVKRIYVNSNWYKSGSGWEAYTGLAYGTTYYFDLLGRNVAVEDAEGRITKYIFDLGGRTIEIYFDCTSSTYHHKITYTYDKAGNRTKVTTPKAMETDPTGQTVDTVYAFDPLGRLEQVTYPSPGPTESFNYDANDNLVWKQDGKGNKFTYIFDWLNRLKIIVFPGTMSDRTFAYNKASWLKSITDDNTDEEYFYDSFGNLTLKKDWTFDTPKTIEYAYYTGNGVLKSMTFNNETKYHHYDDAIRLIQVNSSSTKDSGTVFVEYAYNKLDMKVWRYHGTDTNNKGSTEYRYRHPMKWLTEVINEKSNGDPISRYKYQDEGWASADKLDKVGNRCRMDIYNSSDLLYATVKYEYDHVYQLEHETRTMKDAYEYTYSYDLAGNRLIRYDGDDQSNDYTTYTHNDFNQLTRVEVYVDSSETKQTDFTFDSNGNLTNSSISVGTGDDFGYVYDDLNRMTNVDKNDTEVGSYKFNASGYRVEKTAGSVTTKLFLEGADVLADYEKDGSNWNLVRTYFTPSLDENVIVEVETGADAGTYYYFHDGLGSVRQLYTSSETEKYSYDYKAFGEFIGSFSGWNRYTYTARESESDLEMYYCRDRNYSYTYGRFISPDRVCSFNRYLYTYNNPVRFYDPYGNIGVSERYEEHLTDFLGRILRESAFRTHTARYLSTTAISKATNKMDPGEKIADREYYIASWLSGGFHDKMKPQNPGLVRKAKLVHKIEILTSGGKIKKFSFTLPKDAIQNEEWYYDTLTNSPYGALVTMIPDPGFSYAVALFDWPRAGRSLKNAKFCYVYFRMDFEEHYVEKGDLQYAFSIAHIEWGFEREYKNRKGQWQKGGIGAWLRSFDFPTVVRIPRWGGKASVDLWRKTLDDWFKKNDK